MSKQISYYYQLDSIRALAVIMVLVVHFLPNSGAFKEIPYFHFGVDLFFSISGFLITAILLKTREKNANEHRFRIIKNFVIRRSLRLFPIFYLFLFSLIISSIFTGIYLWNRGNVMFYFTYTANILFYFKGFQSELLNHIWSLCVEEQFYLFWPWVILFLRFEKIKYAILIFILSGIFCWSLFFNLNIRMLPFGNLHTLGVGALLAYLWIYHQSNKTFIYIVNNAKKYFILSLILFISFLVLISYIDFNFKWLIIGLREFGLIIVLFFLLLSSIIGWSGFVGAIANNNSVQYIGRISYGIYLYHKPIPFLLAALFYKLQIVFMPIILIFIYVLITLIIASLSYKYIEIPFLKLKEKFDS